MARYIKTRTIDSQGRSSSAWTPEPEISGGGSDSPALETPTGDVDGENNEFVFSKRPIVVFRNGVMETRLGSIVGSTFTFETPPETGDDVEGIV